eukprot:1142557-Rhodomonas_salina.1
MPVHRVSQPTRIPYPHQYQYYLLARCATACRYLPREAADAELARRLASGEEEEEEERGGGGRRQEEADA